MDRYKKLYYIWYTKDFKARPDIKIIKQKLIKKYGKPDFSYEDEKYTSHESRYEFIWGDGKGKDIYTIKKNSHKYLLVRIYVYEDGYVANSGSITLMLNDNLTERQNDKWKEKQNNIYKAKKSKQETESISF